MIILHLLASNSYSGAENVVCTMINTLKDENEIYYCSPKGPICNVLKKKQIKYIELEKVNFKSLKKVIKKIKPDIIHAHDFKMSVMASMFGNKIKIISQIHKNDPALSKLSIKSLVYLIACKRINKIICVSNKINEEWIIKKYNNKKINILYNIIDISRMKKTNNKIYDILYVGRMSEEKNPKLFIEIIKKLNDKNLKIAMIGDGPQRDEIEKQAKNLNIEFLGFIQEPYQYMQKSKIMIVPSKWEGFGLTALEGIANGAYVLNSGMGGLKEIFENSKEYICDLDVDKYTKKIQEIIYENKKMEQVNIEKFTNKKSWKNKILEIYGGKNNEK